MKTNRIIKLLTISSILLFCTAAFAWEDNGKIKVMTQNQYLGADLAPLLAAPSPEEFNAALVSVLQKIASSRFTDRAKRQASQIAKERPHVVALQEVWRFECQDLEPPMTGKGCNDPMVAGAFVDQLEETLGALKAQGARYKVVAKVKNLDVSSVHIPGLPAGIPFNINGSMALLNTIDRDVLLARKDVRAKAVDFTNVCPSRISLDGCNFQAVVNALTPVGELPIQRGFVAADARIGHKNYRIVTTHLEVREPQPGNAVTRFFQAAQAAELIQTLQLTTPKDKSLLLLGDMNSSPDDVETPGPLPLPAPFDNGIVPPYIQFTNAGYTDNWMLRRHYSPGFTCCQDENLLNLKSNLYERIDLVLSLQEPAWVEDIDVVGDRKSDKTFPPAPRLWPSDHGGVAGELHFW